MKLKREQSDYDDFYVASRDEANEQLNTVKFVLPLIKSYLSQNDIWNKDMEEER